MISTSSIRRWIDEGAKLKPYTELPGFEELVLEESYVLSIQANPSRVTFDVDLVLAPRHPSTRRRHQPSATDCFRTGCIRFSGVRRLVWEGQGAPPATDATDEPDYGHIDSFAWEDGTFLLDGDWGRMELSAAAVEVEISN